MQEVSCLKQCHLKKDFREGCFFILDQHFGRHERMFYCHTKFLLIGKQIFEDNKFLVICNIWHFATTLNCPSVVVSTRMMNILLTLNLLFEGTAMFVRCLKYEGMMPFLDQLCPSSDSALTFYKRNLEMLLIFHLLILCLLYLLLL